MIGALVAYKGKCAKILSSENNKFEIEVEGKTQRKVRVKDFRYLHPNFETPTQNLTADVALLSDFSEQTLVFSKMCVWLFGEYSPHSAWQTYLFVEDGTYAFWQKDSVFIRPAEQIAKIKLKHATANAEKLALENCIQNIRNNTLDEHDNQFIQEVEKVANGQLKNAKLLKILKIPSTPIDAHKLLVKINYWDLYHNPYPQRHKIETDSELPAQTKTVSRTDLTHLTSYAIDNANSNDADDAISVDNDRVWIHVADVSSVISDELLYYAQHRISNLYLPEQTIHMLPMSIITDCALGNNETSNALSVGFNLAEGVISNIEVVYSVIKVTNISYTKADTLISDELSTLQILSQHHKQYRKTNGAFSLNLPKVNIKLQDKKVIITEQQISPSREMVAEFMIMAGRAVAEFAVNNNITMPFVTQEKGEFSDEVLTNNSLSLAESFTSTKLFKRSCTDINPNLHFGLGLDKYLRFTSPLRRYLDLISHYQITNFIAGTKVFDAQQMQTVITMSNAIMPTINKTVRESEMHYKLLFLIQNKDWSAPATVLDIRQDKVLIMITSLAMIANIKHKAKVNDTIIVSVKTIDIFSQSVDFKVLS